MEEALRLKDEQGWSGEQGRVSQAQGTACAKVWEGCPSRAGGTELGQSRGTIWVLSKGTGETQKVLDKEIRVIVRCGLPEDTLGARQRHGGRCAGRGPHRRERGPGGERFPSCLLGFASQMPSQEELSKVDGLRRPSAWPAAGSWSACEKRHSATPPQPDQPGPWWPGVPQRWPGTVGRVAGRVAGQVLAPFQQGAILSVPCVESG